MTAPIVWAVTAVAVLGALALATVTDPLAAVRDPVAARDAIALMQAGEHATYVAEYAYTRADLHGRKYTSTEYDVRGPKGTLTRNGTSLAIDWNGQGSDCTMASAKPSCLARPVASGLPESEVLRVAVDAGIYDVTRAPDTTIAGEPARCFVIRAHRLDKQLPNDFGSESDMCFDARGVPLRFRRYTDELNGLEALGVGPFDRAALAPVIAGFDRTAPQVGR